MLYYLYEMNHAAIAPLLPSNVLSSSIICDGASFAHCVEQVLAQAPQHFVILGTSFGGRTPTAYETLLVDAMVGDATLYTRQDMVEASWTAVQPILDVWSESKGDHFPNYAAGTWGPQASDEMLARRGHEWRVP